MSWKRLPTLSAPMSLQMALDEILFDRFKQNLRSGAVLRFYHSSSPWISVGYSFKTKESLRSSELIRAHSEIPLVSRMTGGGCVLHGEDLIFSLIASCAEIPRLQSVKESYAAIHHVVKMGIGRFGMETRFYEEDEELPKGADCFSYPVARDLSLGNRKVAGGAQKRSEGVLLHHESIVLPRYVNSGDLAHAIQAGFEKVFNVSVELMDFDPEIYFEAERKCSTL
ncbi:MAG: Octanoyltransferase LipM [Candidatus Omnitrophica bacterium ADurb.Bin292]|jgi:lipoate-protein ligase A|nr:MAG: Octanoyltransferase LipM [Candidatus Omnitrophica bacterium ADurb.Bin292]HPW76974.1 hypothetical protein [Candidatus Omnitrophota bacterium]HQB11551.1 hypothetical protein [Candidatus Omnitrophota bacterium]